MEEDDDEEDLVLNEMLKRLLSWCIFIRFVNKSSMFYVSEFVIVLFCCCPFKQLTQHRGYVDRVSKMWTGIYKQRKTGKTPMNTSKLA